MASLGDQLPTFLVIGAQKAGTSWLYHMLCQHPEVAVCHPKEVCYFNKVYNHRKGLEWYRRHFPVHPGVKAIGDFTPNYLWTTKDPKEIAESERTTDVPRFVHDALPDAKLIVSLRDPVKRAISAYYHLIRHGEISPSQSILEFLDRFGIVTMGYYDLHLDRWMQYFNWDQFLILIYEEDIQARKRGTLARVCRHIGVNESFIPGGLEDRFNVQGSHFEMRIARLSPLARGALRRFLPDRVKRAAIWDIPMRDEEIHVLRSRFASHTARLSEILGRELPWS